VTAEPTSALRNHLGMSRGHGSDANHQYGDIEELRHLDVTAITHAGDAHGESGAERPSTASLIHMGLFVSMSRRTGSFNRDGSIVIVGFPNA
jgi:hypothetical protein